MSFMKICLFSFFRKKNLILPAEEDIRNTNKGGQVIDLCWPIIDPTSHIYIYAAAYLYIYI